VQGARMPELTINLPTAITLIIIIMVVGALVLFFTLKATGRVQSPTPIPSQTTTPTITVTPTETPIPSETPTLTPQPPRDYTVKSGDNCGSIAAFFDVDYRDIILLNSLNSTCTNLGVGQVIKVPWPTPTPLPAATATLEPASATRASCQTVDYTVQANDTLSSIAINYGVSMQSIKEWNGLSTDGVFLDQRLTIPLCMRAATPGPSPTPTTPPPYPAPNLLLPADGAPFTIANDSVSLQWASVGVLRENETYQVTVEDVTGGTGNKLIEYVTDTKFIVPVSFRPSDGVAHVMRWGVQTVRQAGTDSQGNPIWASAGAASQLRTFTWSISCMVLTPTQ
jgi:LysM repeat protein